MKINKIIKLPFIFIWRCWFWIMCGISTITVGVIIYLLSYQKNYKLTYFFMRMWAAVIFYGCGFSYKLKSNAEPKIGENYLIIANHTSMVDVMLTYVLHPNHPIVFVGKKELEKLPVFGKIYSHVSILVDRKNEESRRHVYSQVKEKVKQNKNVVIYPEGGVADDRSIILDKFKDGAFSISVTCDLPIIVYVYHGLKNMFPYDSTIGRPGRVLVERLAILNPEHENRKTLKQKAFDMMYEKLKNDKIVF